MEFYDVEHPARGAADRSCCSVEQEELGITVGLQDRVIQVYEGLVYMDFDRELRADRRRPARATATSRSIRRCCRRSTSRTTRRSASRPRCSTTTSASASIAATRRSSARCGALPDWRPAAARRCWRGDAERLARPHRRELRHAARHLPACRRGRSRWSTTARALRRQREVRRLGRRHRRHLQRRSDVRERAGQPRGDRVSHDQAADRG